MKRANTVRPYSCSVRKTKKGAVKKVPKKKGCDLAKKQDSSLFCGIIKVS